MIFIIIILYIIYKLFLQNYLEITFRNINIKIHFRKIIVFIKQNRISELPPGAIPDDIPAKLPAIFRPFQEVLRSVIDRGE